MTDDARLLSRTASIATDYLASLATRPVGRPVDLAALRTAMGGPLPEDPTDPLTVVEDLAAAADPGLVASAGPRYFGFVVGGSLPAALAADWLTSAWDQNAGLYVLSPAAAVAEEVAAAWLVELLGLPAGTSVGFVTGATMANFTALAAARHARPRQDRLGRRATGSPGCAAGDGRHPRRHRTSRSTPRSRCSGSGARASASARSPPTSRAGCGPTPCARRSPGIDGPVIVCAQAGQREQRGVRPVRGAHPDRPRARRVGPHRRRVRDLGGRRSRRCAT